MQKSIEMFFYYALLWRSDVYEEHGDVFFVVCPLRNCECKAPKIGINCNQSLTILFPFDSSRFSGQISRYIGAYNKKDISMFHAKKDISMLNVKFLS